MLGTIPDLLRLLAVPILGWAAWRDIQTRRVPNQTWLPLLAIAVVALALDAHAAWQVGNDAFFVRVAISLGFIVPLSYAFWRMGGFGGADAKAFMVIAVLFPAFPAYDVAGVSVPLEASTVGVFSLSILSNTVVVGLAFPLAVALGNLLRGHVSPAMLVGRPVPWEEIPETHGRLLETPEGTTLSGLDLDALRMYLEWRGETLAGIRADPDRLRDPATLPEEPTAPGDGAVATDGGEDAPSAGEERVPGSDDESDGIGDDESATNDEDSGEPTGDVRSADEDPWGAAAFLEDLDHGAYGTSAAQLRDGLDLLAEADDVWVSPGIPFLVPTFVGLLVALTYGDVLFVLMRAVGIGG